MKKILDFAFRLAFVCVIASGVLAAVYKGTAGRISANKAAEKMQRLKWVLPGCDSIEPALRDEIEFYIGKKDGRVYGYAVETSARGYSGPIRMLVGMDTDGKITDFSILSHTETPGLGAKATGSFFTEQFKGLNSEQLKLKTDSPDGTIDALTAATITSRAVMDGLKEGLKKISGIKGGEGS